MPVAAIAARFAEREYGISAAALLLRLDVGSPYHLDPLFGFISNELAEIRWHTAKHTAAELGDACPYFDRRARH